MRSTYVNTIIKKLFNKTECKFMNENLSVKFYRYRGKHKQRLTCDIIIMCLALVLGHMLPYRYSPESQTEPKNISPPRVSWIDITSFLEGSSPQSPSLASFTAWSQSDPWRNIPTISWLIVIIAMRTWVNALSCENGSNSWIIPQDMESGDNATAPSNAEE